MGKALSKQLKETQKLVSALPEMQHKSDGNMNNKTSLKRSVIDESKKKQQAQAFSVTVRRYATVAFFIAW